MLLFSAANTAAGNGTTDDTAALQAALNTDGFLMLDPLKTYLVSTLDLASDMRIIGNRSTLKTVSNAPILKMEDVSTSLRVRNSIEGVRFLGEGRLTGENLTGKTLQQGISALWANGVRIRYCDFKDLQGGGMKAQETVSGDRGNQMIGCFFDRCGTGVELAAHAEYWSITGCNFTGNYHALKNYAGNLSLSGGQISRNVHGVHIAAGDNNGHGHISNVLLNHNSGYAINFAGTSASQDIESGFEINNVNVFDGDIRVAYGRGVHFNGGNFALGTSRKMELVASTGLKFMNGKWQGTPTITKTSMPADFAFINMFDLLGAAVATP